MPYGRPLYMRVQLYEGPVIGGSGARFYSPTLASHPFFFTALKFQEKNITATTMYIIFRPKAQISSSFGNTPSFIMRLIPSKTWLAGIYRAIACTGRGRTLTG